MLKNKTFTTYCVLASFSLQTLALAANSEPNNEMTYLRNAVAYAGKKDANPTGLAKILQAYQIATKNETSDERKANFILAAREMGVSTPKFEEQVERVFSTLKQGDEKLLQKLYSDLSKSVSNRTGAQFNSSTGETLGGLLLWIVFISAIGSIMRGDNSH